MKTTDTIYLAGDETRSVAAEITRLEQFGGAIRAAELRANLEDKPAPRAFRSPVTPPPKAAAPEPLAPVVEEN